MKCYECGRELVAFSGFECSYCRKTFCTEHRLPEAHHCRMDAGNKERKLKQRRKEHKPGMLSRIRKLLG
jgi:predicted nucleic acid binding AN1-type Zn finger protein